MTGYHVIIPARYASTRLPGKPLRDVAGKPLIQRVVEAAEDSRAARIVVATDDSRIAEAVIALGVEAITTANHHQSGTDRIAEVVDYLELDDDAVVVNLQGDEPLVPPELPDQVAALLDEHSWASMSTLCTPLTAAQSAQDPDIVKVVRSATGEALYFSRAPIPYERDSSDSVAEYYRHIGIYAYRAGYLRRHAARPACALEITEKLEQLRALYYGERIAVAVSSRVPGTGVDNEEDLKRVSNMFDRTAE